MSKPEIFTTAYTIDKASWVHVSDNVGFMEDIKNHLGRQLAERIFQECQSGEKIVTVGNTYKKEIPELYHVEIREEVRIEDLVRCKDCNNSDWYKSLDGKCLCYCMVHGKGGYTENDFCSRGERGEANNV